jgi:hypothetical protein
MISLDQDDDLADKRTVLVEPGGDMGPPGQMMDPQRPMSMSQTPAIGQSSAMLSPYGRQGPTSAPGLSQSGERAPDQTAPHVSSSGAAAQQKSSRRNLFVILFVLALLAPIGALVFRWLASGDKDIDKQPPVVEKPKPKPVPEPPKEKPKFKLKVVANKPINLKRDGASMGTKAAFEEEIEKSDTKIHFSVATPGCKPIEFEFVPTEAKEVAIKCGKKK